MYIPSNNLPMLGVQNMREENKSQYFSIQMLTRQVESTTQVISHSMTDSQSQISAKRPTERKRYEAITDDNDFKFRREKYVKYYNIYLSFLHYQDKFQQEGDEIAWPQAMPHCQKEQCYQM